MTYPVLKAKGYTAGINILATIGHHHEDLDHTVKGYRTMVGRGGEISKGTFCMNDETYRREYIEEIYRIYVLAKSEFIWVDDDICQGHMPIGEGCYCEACIEIFNRKNGTTFTRETLVKSLGEDGYRSITLPLIKPYEGIVLSF